MATVGSLVVYVSANTAKFQGDLNAASGRVKKFAGETSGATQAIGSLKNALGALGVGVGVMALVQKFNTLRTEIDAAAKDAIQLGSTIENIRGLQFAGQISGVDPANIIKDLEKMQRGIGEALGGDKTKIEVFDRLGLSVQELNRLDPVDALMEIAEKIRAIESPAMRTAAAMEIFGRSGGETIPMLMEGKQGIRDLIEEYKALSGTTSKSAAEMEAMNDSIERIEAWAGGRMEENVLAIAKAFNVLAEAAGAVGLNVKKEGNIGNELAKATTRSGIAALVFTIEKTVEAYKIVTGQAAAAAKAVEDKAAADRAAKVAAVDLTAALAKQTLEWEEQAKAVDKLAKGIALRAAAKDKWLMDVNQALDALRGMQAASEAGARGEKIDPIDALIKNVLRGLPVAEMDRFAAVLNKVGAEAKAARSAEEQMNRVRETAAQAQRDRDAQMQRGQALYEELRTPLEKFQAELADLNKLYDVGAIDERTAARAVAAAKARYGQGIGDQFAEPTFAAAAERGSAAAAEIIARARATGNEPREERMAKLAQQQLDTQLQTLTQLKQGLKIAGLAQTNVPK